jgi:hypothetical protein
MPVGTKSTIIHLMSDWLRAWIIRQWQDVKGNFKWWALVTVVSLTGLATQALVHGLALWQKIGLGVLFLLQAAFVLAITGWLWPRSPSRPHPESDKNPPSADLEIRFGNISPYVFREPAHYTHYRMGIRSPLITRTM